MNWSKLANTAKVYLGLGTEEECLQRGSSREGGTLTPDERQRAKRLSLITTLMLMVGLASLLMFVDSLAWQIAGVAALAAVTTAVSALFHNRSTPTADSAGPGRV